MWHLAWCCTWSAGCPPSPPVKVAASGASDFGGGYEMPGHGRWMQDSTHSHHFNRKIIRKSYFPNLPGGHFPTPGGRTSKDCRGVGKHSRLGDFLPRLCAKKSSPDQVAGGTMIFTPVLWNLHKLARWAKNGGREGIGIRDKISSTERMALCTL